MHPSRAVVKVCQVFILSAPSKRNSWSRKRRQEQQGNQVGSMKSLPQLKAFTLFQAFYVLKLLFGFYRKCTPMELSSSLGRSWCTSWSQSSLKSGCPGGQHLFNFPEGFCGKKNRKGSEKGSQNEVIFHFFSELFWGLVFDHLFNGF